MTNIYWQGPIGFEGVATGDKRFIEVGALRWETLPAPIRYAAKDVGAHDGAEVAGRILTIERRDTEDPNVKAIWATGDFDVDGEVGAEAKRHVEKELTNGISMDLDDVSFEVRETTMASGEVGEEMATTSARVRAATIVAIPAFEGARVEMATEMDADQLKERVELSRKRTVEAETAQIVTGTTAVESTESQTEQTADFSYLPPVWRSNYAGQLPMPSLVLSHMEQEVAALAADLGKSDAETLETLGNEVGNELYPKLYGQLKASVKSFEKNVQASDVDGIFNDVLDLYRHALLMLRATDKHELASETNVGSALRGLVQAADEMRGISQRLSEGNVIQALVDDSNGELKNETHLAEASRPHDDLDYDDDEYAAAVETFKKNWVDKVGGLPKYIREVAKGIRKSNPSWSESRRIATAVNQIKRWAAGGGNVTAKTRAKAAAALAEWEAKKAAAKATATVGVQAFDSTDYERVALFITATIATAKALGWTPDPDGPKGYGYRNEDGWKILVTHQGTGQGNAFALFNEDGDQYGYAPSFVEAAFHAMELANLGDEDEDFDLENDDLSTDEDAPTDEDEAMANTMIQTFSANVAAAVKFAEEAAITIVFDQAGNILGVVEPDAIKPVAGGGKPAEKPAETPAVEQPAAAVAAAAGTDAFAAAVPDDEEAGAGEEGSAPQTMPVYDAEGNLIGVVKIEYVQPLAEPAKPGTVAPVVTTTAAAAETETLAVEEVEGPDELEDLSGVQYAPEDRASLVASGGTQQMALSAPIAPPKDWFFMAEPDQPTPLTITPEGQVYGHLASWNVCHLAMPNGVNECVTAPRSNTNYSMFHLGYVTTAEGVDVPVGRISMNTGHAGDDWNPRRALAHYENTGLAAADVHARDGKHGIWFSGALRPDATPAQIRSLKASPLSGDWRRTTAGMELVMALAVNQPGFAVPRPKGLVASGALQSLMAAGMVPPKTIIKPGRPGALSTEDIMYLKRAAERERNHEGDQLKLRAEAARARVKVGAFAAQRAAEKRKGN
jgi:hypothetical protein